jgi:fatty aldehyde-generating acyl-ACP reductase
MFGLIGHLTSLDHARSLAYELGYLEYAERDLDFWCMAPPQTLDEIKVRSITGQVIEGRYIESCFVPEMLSQNRYKAAIRKVINAMAHAQKKRH